MVGGAEAEGVVMIICVHLIFLLLCYIFPINPSPHLVIRALSEGRGVDIRARGHEVNKVQPKLADVGADLDEGVLAGGGVGVGGGEARVLDMG